MQTRFNVELQGQIFKIDTQLPRFTRSKESLGWKSSQGGGNSRRRAKMALCSAKKGKRGNAQEQE